MSDIATPKDEEIDCPFCKKGKIAITTIPEHYSYSCARAFGKVKRIPVVHPERITVHNSCKNCKKSKAEIKEAMQHGTTKSHEEILKRIKASGLPTRIEG
jgi:hypothetical protein